MPLYDYQCKACQKTTEVRHGFREAFEGACPSCGGTEMARLFSAAPIIFNGSGFYVTDSRPASGGESKKSESSAA